jgi:hypothetical protein
VSWIEFTSTDVKITLYDLGSKSKRITKGAIKKGQSRETGNIQGTQDEGKLLYVPFQHEF